MGRLKMSDIEKYQKKLERLIYAVPYGYKLCYNNQTCEVFVVDDGAEFHDTTLTRLSTACIGSTTPIASTGYSIDDGNDRDCIIGDGIYIDMEAVQQ